MKSQSVEFSLLLFFLFRKLREMGYCTLDPSLPMSVSDEGRYGDESLLSLPGWFVGWEREERRKAEASAFVRCFVFLSVWRRSDALSLFPNSQRFPLHIFLPCFILFFLSRSGETKCILEFHSYLLVLLCVCVWLCGGVRGSD